MLTGHSFEDEAEANCEKNLALAEEIDPTDPEVYQVRCFALHYTR